MENPTSRNITGVPLAATGHVWAWSRNDLGCRLVQEALETGGREAAELATELEGHVLEAAMPPGPKRRVSKIGHEF